MPAIYELQHRVLDAEIDELGHVGNVHYLSWLMRAATEHSIAQGWPWERYQALGGAFVVRRHELDYLRSAMPGERVSVRTWIASAARASCVRASEIVRGEQLGGERVLLRARTTWAFIDLRRGVPCRVPSELLEAFEIGER